MKLSVVMPVYNERAFIGRILDKVRAVDIDKEVIVIDDCSTDGTREFLQELTKNAEMRGSLKILFQDKNYGKGAALKRGFEVAVGDIIIVQDADLEYDPQDYHRLLSPIEKGEADVVYGSRFLGGPHRVLYFWHYVGNKLLTTLSNMLTNLNLSDMETGYKVFRKEVLAGIEIKQNRFGFEPEITAKVAKKEWRIYEVPISYHGRTYEEGKKINWKDGVKAIRHILKYNLFD